MNLLLEQRMLFLFMIWMSRSWLNTSSSVDILRDDGQLEITYNIWLLGLSVTEQSSVMLLNCWKLMQLFSTQKCVKSDGRCVDFGLFVWHFWNENYHFETENYHFETLNLSMTWFPWCLCPFPYYQFVKGLTSYIQ